jgi:hypothetical protein
VVAQDQLAQLALGVDLAQQAGLGRLGRAAGLALGVVLRARPADPALGHQARPRRQSRHTSQLRLSQCRWTPLFSGREQK